MGFRGSLSLPITSVNVRTIRTRLTRDPPSEFRDPRRDKMYRLFCRGVVLVKWRADEQPVLLPGRTDDRHGLPDGVGAAELRGTGPGAVGGPEFPRRLRAALLGGPRPSSPAPPAGSIPPPTGRPGSLLRAHLRLPSPPLDLGTGGRGGPAREHAPRAPAPHRPLRDPGPRPRAHRAPQRGHPLRLPGIPGHVLPAHPADARSRRSVRADRLPATDGIRLSRGRVDPRP